MIKQAGSAIYRQVIFFMCLLMGNCLLGKNNTSVTLNGEWKLFYGLCDKKRYPGRKIRKSRVRLWKETFSVTLSSLPYNKIPFSLLQVILLNLIFLIFPSLTFSLPRTAEI